MDILPKTIVFHPPLEQVNATRITLKNSGSQTLVYKIKTTAPQLYCVKPNSSSIPAGHSLEVTITRQGKEVDTSKPCKDKFLVLSAGVSDELLQEHDKVSELWPEIESKGKAGSLKIDAQKLQVQYQPGGEQSSVAASQPASQESAGPEREDSVEYHDQKQDTPARDGPTHAASAPGSHGSASEAAPSPVSKSVDGIPPKSREIDMGDAKTGPHLDNSYLPDGPPPERAEDLEKHLIKAKKEQEKKEGPEEIAKEYAEAAAAGAAAAVEEISKKLDSEGVTHKSSEFYVNQFHPTDKDGDSKDATSTDAGKAPTSGAKSASTASSSDPNPKHDSKPQPAPSSAQSGPSSAQSSKQTTGPTPSAPGPVGVAAVPVGNAALSGEKGKMTFHSQDKPKQGDGDGKGKVTITDHTEKHEKPQLPIPKLDFTESKAAQEIPLNVTVILVFLAFFIGWKFF